MIRKLTIKYWKKKVNFHINALNYFSSYKILKTTTRFKPFTGRKKNFLPKRDATYHINALYSLLSVKNVKKTKRIRKRIKTVLIKFLIYTIMETRKYEKRLF